MSVIDSMVPAVEVYSIGVLPAHDGITSYQRGRGHLYDAGF